MFSTITSTPVPLSKGNDSVTTECSFETSSEDKTLSERRMQAKKELDEFALNTKVFKLLNNDKHFSNIIKDLKIHRDLLTENLNHLNKQAFLKKWDLLCAQALINQPDYFVIAIGSCGSPSQIRPTFVEELAKQNNKIMLLNIDSGFSPEDDIEHYNNITHQFIDSSYDTLDYSLTKNLESFLKTGKNLIFIWYCSPVSIPLNFFKLTEKFPHLVGKSLFYISAYHDWQPVLLANSNYIQRTTQVFQHANENNGYETLKESKDSEYQNLIAFLWGKRTLWEGPSRDKEIQKYSPKFGFIKPFIQDITIADLKNATLQIKTEVNEEEQKPNIDIKNFITIYNNLGTGLSGFFKRNWAKENKLSEIKNDEAQRLILEHAKKDNRTWEALMTLNKNLKIPRPSM